MENVPCASSGSVPATSAFTRKRGLPYALPSSPFPETLSTTGPGTGRDEDVLAVLVDAVELVYVGRVRSEAAVNVVPVTVPGVHRVVAAAAVESVFSPAAEHAVPAVAGAHLVLAPVAVEIVGVLLAGYVVRAGEPADLVLLGGAFEPVGPVGAHAGVFGAGLGRGQRRPAQRQHP